MTLLETIRALDAPYVVWLHPTDDIGHAASYHMHPNENRYGSFIPTDRRVAVEIRYLPASATEKSPLVPTPAEIDALLEGVGA